ncbi:MAG TPA: hypothetical protein VNO34_09330 [Actinomycetota bacterium]|nr:hypothetical protein [Actinomycetota bacterium]
MIRTTCPGCGEVDLRPDAVSLSVESPGRDGVYRFTCPRCGELVEKPADRKIVALLLSAGVEFEGARHPQGRGRPGSGGSGGPGEPRRPWPEARPGGPPFTADDVIDFHLLLWDDERLYRALPRD